MKSAKWWARRSRYARTIGPLTGSEQCSGAYIPANVVLATARRVHTDCTGIELTEYAQWVVHQFNKWVFLISLGSMQQIGCTKHIRVHTVWVLTQQRSVFLSVSQLQRRTAVAAPGFCFGGGEARTEFHTWIPFKSCTAMASPKFRWERGRKFS